MKKILVSYPHTSHFQYIYQESSGPFHFNIVIDWFLLLSEFHVFK